MMQGMLWAALGLAASATLARAGDSAATAASSRPTPLKVLFLGNSQMSWFDVPRMVQMMSESAPPDSPRVQASSSLVGGASLRTHWETREARLEAGQWDYVVIQEIFNRDNPEFSTYAARFDELIRKNGAKMLLFATANVTRHYDPKFSFPDSTRHLNDIQIAFAKQHGIGVAAAGYAWIRYLGEDPSEAQVLDLYASDKGHPGLKGSYIYACLLYACITGKSPMGLTSEFPDIKGGVSIPRPEATKLQQAAWEEYLEQGKLGDGNGE